MSWWSPVPRDGGEWRAGGTALIECHLSKMKIVIKYNLTADESVSIGMHTFTKESQERTVGYTVLFL